MNESVTSVIVRMGKPKILRQWGRSEGQLLGLLAHLRNSDPQTAKHLEFAIELATQQIQLIRRMPREKRVKNLQMELQS